MKSLFTQIQSGICIVTASTGLLLAVPAQADVEITSAGPLVRIGLTPDGNFYANHAATSPSQLYYSNTAAIWGVYDADNNKMFAPANIPAGGNLAPRISWTPVAQSGPTGSGTVLDPFIITNTMTSGTGIDAVITMSYVTGDDAFTSSLSVTDTSGADRNLRLFFGGDLYYGGNDNGYPFCDPVSGAVGGSTLPSGAGFKGLLIPLTPASAYTASSYSSVWSQIGAHQLNSTCASGYMDFGAALQWNILVPANGTTRVDAGNAFGNVIFLVPGQLPGGIVGTPYSQPLNVIGGTAPYTLSIASGALPPGIVFNPATRTFEGTPTATGSYPFVVHLVDSTTPTPMTRDYNYVINVTGVNPPPNPGTAPDYERVQTHADTEAAITRDGTDGQTINGVFAPKLNDRGQQGAVFVFGYLPESVAVAPNTLWYFDSAKNWHLFADCRAAPAFFTGELDVIHLIPIVTEAIDLSALKDGELYIGYGLGGYAQPSGVACNDMFARQNWKKVYTVQ